ncbi:hypothetical protein [Rhizorhabdus dicambivorans]|uniref:Uncharacterized protein n=1 Tax=Rhizorhabdus dicambivorans TaxID=1850238 RepID=A0A2A4FSC5_9SPHN|nr:hypothetical protein [Rhizorhabdus dicambivorans]ATE66459.1 hypothetical protein CMV14_20300 [Rhizorhabdus dicambivorans]PCE41049.1 hypothetical protein COO09_17020 [Rhizorhabdus dicambivorans]
MSDPQGLTAAGTALRETSKWLVGGVVATAASVFAGSSLSNLGSLDPRADTLRLSLAVAGIAIGFVGLYLILKRAIAVLTVDSVNFRQLAAADAGTELAIISEAVDRKYEHAFPPGISSCEAFVSRVDQVKARGIEDAEAHRFLQQAKAFNDLIMPDAGFLYVRLKFDRLVAILPAAVALVIFGIGIFAWAANPPEPAAPKPAFALSLTSH